MRRLPVYLLVDCSESMAGDAIDSVRSGIAGLLRQLRAEPQALETVSLSVITFSNTAKKVCALTELTQFTSPSLVLGSGTALGSALALWEQSMDRELVRTTPEHKGDWKPICYILTDGVPTDSWEAAADRIKSKVSGKKACVIGVACGPDAAVETLKRITDEVVLARNVTPETLGQFFKWVSASVSMASQALERGGNSQINLDNLPKGCLEKFNGATAEKSSAGTSERFVFMHSRCMKNKGFYIMRFEQQGGRQSLFGTEKKSVYKGVVSHKLESFEFPSDGGTISGPKVSTTQLADPPACPYCANKSWAMCSCGRVHCSPLLEGGSMTLTCPWCGVTQAYAGSSFDVGRGIG